MFREADFMKEFGNQTSISQKYLFEHIFVSQNNHKVSISKLFLWLIAHCVSKLKLREFIGFTNFTLDCRLLIVDCHINTCVFSATNHFRAKQKLTQNFQFELNSLMFKFRAWGTVDHTETYIILIIINYFRT